MVESEDKVQEIVVQETTTEKVEENTEAVQGNEGEAPVEIQNENEPQTE